MATKPVKYFSNLMTGAPQLPSTWGSLVALLDALLINGFNQSNITTLTQTGGVATATFAAPHGFIDDQVVLITDASDTAFNGEINPVVTSPTTFTFPVVGAGASATGAKAKAAPLGFEIAYTATGKRAYRSANILSNRPYLRVDDTLNGAYNSGYAKKGKVTMAETMTNVDTFTAGAGRAPYLPAAPNRNEETTGSGTTVVDGWAKWYYARTSNNNTADSAAAAAGDKSWVLVGDDRGFYLFIAHGGAQRAVYGFTDFASLKTADAFNTILIATENYSSASSTTNNVDTVVYNGPGFGCGFQAQGIPMGKFLMRDHTGYSSYIRVTNQSLSTTDGTTRFSSGAVTSTPWPNGPDFSLLLHPVFLRQESDGSLRGRYPGLMFVINAGSPPDLSVVTDVFGYPGRKFIIVNCDGSNDSAAGRTGRVAIDITGPWW